MIRSYKFQFLFLLCFTLTTFADHHDYQYNDYAHTFKRSKFLPDDNNYYQKCCPQNYKYEKLERKCIKSHGTSIADMVPFLMKVNPFIGLPRCDVIVDHVLLLDDLKSLLDNTVVIEYKNETFPPGRYCIDAIENVVQELGVLEIFQVLEGQQEDPKDLKKDMAILRVCYESDYCTKKQGLKCLKKCCRDGFIFWNETCIFRPEYGVPTEPIKNIITDLTDNFAIHFEDKKYQRNVDYVSYLSDIIISKNAFIKHFWSYRILMEVKNENYCFDFKLTNNNTLPDAILRTCKLDINLINLNTELILGIISCIFLFAAMVVLAFSYKLKEVMHRIVFCFCLARCAELAGFIYSNFFNKTSNIGFYHFCFIKFIILFGLHAESSWLTVMCFDMWRTPRSMTTKVVDKNKSRLTFYYCLYGWCLPAVIIFLFLTLYEDLIPQYSHTDSEFFFHNTFLVIRKDKIYVVLFLGLPIFAAAIANVVFFVLTIRYIMKVTNSIRKMSDTTDEKEQLIAARNKTYTALKLCFTMDIHLSCEIVSVLYSAFKNDLEFPIQILFGALNCYQGIYIFFVFFLWNRWTPVIAETSTNRINRFYKGLHLYTNFKNEPSDNIKEANN